MFDVLKQAVFIGLGLASLSKEKAEQLADEIARGPSFLNRSRKNSKPSSPAGPNRPVRNSTPRSIVGSTMPSSSWASSRPA